MNKIKALFFDQDNTLLNTKETAKKVYSEVFMDISRQTKIDFDDLYNTWKKFLEVVKSSKSPEMRSFSYSLRLVIDYFQLDHEYIFEGDKKFITDLIDQIELTKGTRDFFEKENSLIKVLITESQRRETSMKLHKFGINKKLDLIMTSSDITVMKPNINYLETAWKHFDLKPEECVYIGDSWEKDCQIGQEKGGVGVVFGKKDDRADYSITDMTELFQIIKNQT